MTPSITIEKNVKPPKLPFQLSIKRGQAVRKARLMLRLPLKPLTAVIGSNHVGVFADMERGKRRWSDEDYSLCMAFLELERLKLLDELKLVSFKLG